MSEQEDDVVGEEADQDGELFDAPTEFVPVTIPTDAPRRDDLADTDFSAEASEAPEALKPALADAPTDEGDAVDVGASGLATDGAMPDEPTAFVPTIPPTEDGEPIGDGFDPDSEPIGDGFDPDPDPAGEDVAPNAHPIETVKPVENPNADFAQQLSEEPTAFIPIQLPDEQEAAKKRAAWTVDDDELPEDDLAAAKAEPEIDEEALKFGWGALDEIAEDSEGLPDGATQEHRLWSIEQQEKTSLPVVPIAILAVAISVLGLFIFDDCLMLRLRFAIEGPSDSPMSAVRMTCSTDIGHCVCRQEAGELRGGKSCELDEYGDLTPSCE